MLFSFYIGNLLLFIFYYYSDTLKALAGITGRGVQKKKEYFEHFITITQNTDQRNVVILCVFCAYFYRA